MKIKKMNDCIYRKRLATILLLIGLSFMHTVNAQTVYVTDKVLLGVYGEQQQENLLKVLPTGTPLEILERDGNFAKVRGPDGLEGWVDASYLINDKPSQLLILEQADKQKQMQAELEKVRASLGSLQKEYDDYKRHTDNQSVGGSSARDMAKLKSDNDKLNEKIKSLTSEVESLKKNNETLQENIPDDVSEKAEELKTAREVIAKLEGQLKEKSSGVENYSAELEKMKKEYAAVKEKINDVSKILIGETAAAQGGTNNTTDSAENALSTNWFLVLLLITFIIGIAAGAYLLDMYNVKRHGGFRI